MTAEVSLMPIIKPIAVALAICLLGSIPIILQFERYNKVAKKKTSRQVSLPVPGIRPLFTVRRHIRDRELLIRLENPEQVDKESHDSELDKLELACDTAVDIEQLDIESQHTPEEAEYAIKLFNETLRLALRGRHQRLARVLPWWGLPRHDLSTVKKLKIQYPIPIDECIEMLAACSEVRELHLDSIVAPCQAGPFKFSKLVQLTKLRSLTIRTTVDLDEFFGVVKVPRLRALDMTLACQASPELYKIRWDGLHNVRVQGIPDAHSENHIRHRLDPGALVQLIRIVD
ncbi:hypothetical protein HGRIS_010247 [Hohenbuehelia grisea]|uniref:Uncharacterized protein n=1 Tax=Hohenbuehelia grisea TaxID=104357 RepID=A0ABR3J439_9AGAR